MEDAACLKARYPGQIAAQIAHTEGIVVERWSCLQRRAANRKVQLHASGELQRFLTQVIQCLNILWCRVLAVSVETLKEILNS